MGCDALDDGRAVAVADLNNDGRLDLVIGNNNTRPTIYLNNQARTGNWLRVDLGNAEPQGGRDPLGARVDVVVRHDGKQRTITRWVEAGAGYASQSDYTLHFGLGEAGALESLTVSWPGGVKRTFTGPAIGPFINATVSIRGDGSLAPGPRVGAMAARTTQRGGAGQ
jgi:hypothetical protein